MSRRKTKARKEKIRPGLEIDFDLLDSDLVRCYVDGWLNWSETPRPHIWYIDYVDKEGWDGVKDPERRVMVLPLNNDQDLLEGRRLLRLLRYKSYPDFDTLARLPAAGPGDFLIRKPPSLFGQIMYVRSLVEADMPPGLRDPDSPAFNEEAIGFAVTREIAEAQRFSHADAIRLCVRVMEVLGYQIPGDLGDYFEPIRVEIAAELDTRARRRPASPEILNAVTEDLSREP
jgi:hypothetical protein